MAQTRVEDLSKFKVDRDYTFYPVYFKETNVLTAPTDSKYFEATPVNGGCRLSVNSKYKLTGKITIPAYYNSSPVKEIGVFTNALGAT
jgi:hypothetical protein